MTFTEAIERNRKRFSLMAKEAKIRANKDKLVKEDYKIIKCAEAVISTFVAEHPDVELPYDAIELISQRNATREDINTLEAEVEEMEAE